ncbi:hypothetical protein [Kutzneria sp. NPDC052558]|uniref:hypothetical protein n=1 Tax=Kutzneria sp. NPDC052558 TaxID=3364121 RepID=UPI0037C85654
MRLVLAELRKLDRPLTRWLFGGFLAFCLFWGAIQQFNGSQQWAGLTSQSPLVPAPTGTPSAPPCAVFQLPDGPQCRQRQQEFLADQQKTPAVMSQVHAAQLHDVRTALVLRSSIGAPLLVAGLLASLPGAVVVGLLVSGHVSGEWSGRTLKVLLGQDGRRLRLLLAKLASAWLASGTVLVVAVLASLAVGPILGALFPFDGGSVPHDVGVGFVFGQLATAWLVIAFYMALATLGAVLTRNPLGSFFVFVAVLVASFSVGAVPGLAGAAPTSWVADAMGFTADSPTPHLFAGSTTGTAPVIAVVELAVVSAAAVATAAARFRRADVVV